jgi:hypothetical protein
MEFGLKNQYTVKTRVSFRHLLRHRNSSSANVVLTLKSVCLSVKTTICLSYRVLEMTLLLDYGPSEYISSPSNTVEYAPNHQSFIPHPLKKSKQHFTAHHFFNAHKSRMGIQILTFSAASASMRRCLCTRNPSQCQIKWVTVS